MTAYDIVAIIIILSAVLYVAAIYFGPRPDPIYRESSHPIYGDVPAWPGKGEG